MTKQEFINDLKNTITNTKARPANKELFFSIVNKCINAERYFPASDIWKAYIKLDGTIAVSIMPGNTPEAYEKFKLANAWTSNWRNMTLEEVVDAVNA
jgi:hypothetical protein